MDQARQILKGGGGGEFGAEQYDNCALWHMVFVDNLTSSAS
jgi:hypothetical protein